MGFWGYLIVVRGGEPPSELWEKLPGGVRVADGPLVSLGGGLSLVRSDAEAGDLDAEAVALAAATEAPALMAYVLDSDCAIVHAATPGGVRWSAVLDPGMAEEYGAPTPTPADVEAAVAAAVAWAGEAGLAGDVDALHAAMTESEVFVEHLFDRLLRGLGLTPEGTQRMSPGL